MLSQEICCSEIQIYGIYSTLAAIKVKFTWSFCGLMLNIGLLSQGYILTMCGNVPPITISIQVCTEHHMQDCGKRDASYVATLFENKVRVYDVDNTLTGVFFFDGASNIQKAGENLMAKFPHSFCFHGGEHVVSLFFASIAKIKLIRLLILKTCWVYNIFGSDANHAIYAQFMQQSTSFSNGCPIGLLRGASTRFATWFYSMHWLLHVKRALFSTINQPQFLELVSIKKQNVCMAVQDIEDPKFWKCIYILLCSVWIKSSTYQRGQPLLLNK